jgi:hypothetical protein
MFHQNPSSGSGAVPCIRTDMKLTVAFRNFANAPATGEDTCHTESRVECIREQDVKGMQIRKKGPVTGD